MIRTQVYLTEEQAQDIKTRARRERRTEADVIRDLLDHGRTSSTGQQPLGAEEFLARVRALNLSGPTDLSSRIDDYLYGDDE